MMWKTVKHHALDVANKDVGGWRGRCRCGRTIAAKTKAGLTVVWREHWRETRSRLGGIMLRVNDFDEPVSLGAFLDAMDLSLSTQERNAVDNLDMGQKTVGRGWWVERVA